MYYVMSFVILTLSVAYVYLLIKYKQEQMKVRFRIKTIEDAQEHRLNCAMAGGQFDIYRLIGECSVKEYETFVYFAKTNTLARCLYEQIVKNNSVKGTRWNPYLDGGIEEPYYRFKIFNLIRRNQDEKNDI